VRRLLAAAIVAVALMLSAAPAQAHPLGNFTVNVYTGIRVQPDRLAVDLVVDMAEIPAFQARRGIDADADEQVSDAEGRAYATSACLDSARRVDVSVGGRTVPVRSDRAEIAFPPGTAGLATLRLTCALTADTGLLSEDRELIVRNRNYDDRVGWREIVAVGDRATLLSSDVDRTSISDRLVDYPDDLLQSPPDQRSATLRARPGGPAAPGDAAGVASGPSPTRGVDRLTRSFTELVGRQRLTPAFGLLALGLSVALGAVHALAPGHGKTVMAAYLVGRRGSARQAALIGVTVTATHTAGVLVLGVVLSAVTTLAPEDLYPWLALASGLLLVAIGAGLLRSAVRLRSSGEVRSLVTAGVGHSHPDRHTHDHPPAHAHAHAHDHPPAHAHAHASASSDPVSRRNLVALGLAGGLVPSPSALVVLLGAIALGRAWFGVVLVVGYGAGMAATLTGAGLLLVRFRAALDRGASSARPEIVAVVARVLPVVTAGLVLAGGAVLAVRALTQL